MLMFCRFLWASFYSFFIFHLLGFIIKFIFRLKSNHANPGGNAANFGAIHSPNNDDTVQNSCKVLKSDGFEENDQHFNQNRAETEDSVFKKDEANEKDLNKRAETESPVFKNDGLILSQSKYQFLPRENVCAFITEPKIISFTVEEMFVHSNDVSIPNEVLGLQPEVGFGVQDKNSNDFSVRQGFSENFFEKLDEYDVSLCFEENLKKTEETDEEEPSTEFKTLEDESGETTNSCEQNPDFSEELISVEGKRKYCPSAEFTDEIMNFETSTTIDEREIKKFNKNTNEGDHGFERRTIVSCQEESDEEFIEFHPYFEDHGDDHVEKFSQENVGKFDGSCEVLDISRTRKEFDENFQKFGEIPDGNLEDVDYEENEFDILQEHKYLVNQMKMEMKYSKVKGLPTISEEYEPQKTLVDDLKPLNFDKKLSYKDHMAEIKMFYACYAEKMKKLDILNDQTLHAISFLHLKDSKALMGSKKFPISFIKPHIPKLWLYKQHKIYADSLASATHQDLELYYVGQVCNSWEILSWQYAKAKDLLEYDADQGHHSSSYDKVASEYQQFQVLLERFLEDEAFHGPRILHYVNNRCIFRTLLQIPMIKEDCLKDRKSKEADDDEQINVSLLELADMIKQSMQVFLEFLSTEKIATTMKSKAGKEVNKHDPARAKLLKDIRVTLQQKERRLKDLPRSRNYLVKKFQKHQDGARNNEELTSQVELKLVARVLSLTKISTDQLMWCQGKLDDISFLGGNVHVEHSFLLFPC